MQRELEANHSNQQCSRDKHVVCCARVRVCVMRLRVAVTHTCVAPRSGRGHCTRATIFGAAAVGSDSSTALLYSCTRVLLCARKKTRTQTHEAEVAAIRVILLRQRQMHPLPLYCLLALPLNGEVLSGENDEEVQRSKRQDGYKRTRTNKTLLVYSTKTEWEATTIMSAGNANLSNAAVRSREL